MNDKIRDLLDLPDQVRRGDFVLRLSEGVEKADETLDNYVVTEQLVKCFDDALTLVKSAVEGDSSKGCYLHGSFGSGKSHFMAILHLLLRGNTKARSIPQLASVVAKHNSWTDGRKFLLLPYHMIGKDSMEAAILGGYVEMIHLLHPDAKAPAVYRSESLLADADKLRASMGEDKFFAMLNEGAASGADEWGDLSEGWDAGSYDQAKEAPPHAEARIRLIGDLVDRFFTSARQTSQFVDLGDGLSIISRHAKSLGYDAVILFLDELILWLASRAADVAFVNQEGVKIANLVEAQSAERPVPLVSFVARQRDLKELVGDKVSGANYLSFSDTLDWWEARFATIKLADSNLPAIAEKRVLKPRSEAARSKIDQAFAETSRLRTEVMDVLLTRNSDKEMFRKIYPFSPAFMDTLVEMSFLLQRERTALKVMLQLLIEQGDSLQLGDIVPVGDLFDAIAEGDEAVSDEIRRRFDFAKKLYEEKFRPILESEYGLRFDEIASHPAEDPKLKGLRNDDRLVKTILLAALAPNVEALRGLNASRLAALNHGTIRSPIPGREAQVVLSKCRKWAAAVGQLRIGEDNMDPLISIQLTEVDTDTILDSAKIFDNHGNRVRKIRGLLFQALGVEDTDELSLRHTFLWRGTDRACTLLYKNIRELPLSSFLANGDEWTVVIDWPFDEEGHGVSDDRAQLNEFQEQHPEGSRTLVIQPSFLGHAALRDLGKLVILDQLMRGENFANHSKHLSPANREVAKTMLANQLSQLEQQVVRHLESAYGISSAATDALDIGNLVEGVDHFQSLEPSLQLRIPVGANLAQAFWDLLDQGLRHQFPAHPDFEVDVKLGTALLKRVLGEVERATQHPEGRVKVEGHPLRKELRQVADPLKLGSMSETHFLLGDFWKNHFDRKLAETGAALTVENLYQWMDEPEPRGLPVALRHLVVLVYAAQTNHSFFLHGSAVEASLEGLRPEMELRTVELPSEAEWQTATERAGHLFGVAASQLVNAANVSRFCEEVKKVLSDSALDCERLVQRLEQVYGTRGLAPGSSRLLSAKAAKGLVGVLSPLNGRKLVSALVAWSNPSTDSAVGSSLKKAGAVSTALQHVKWKSFEMLETVSESHQSAATRVLDDLRSALEADEHVTALSPKLNTLEERAMGIIQEALAASKPAPPPPPLPPTPDNIPITPPPPKGARRVITGLKEVKQTELESVIQEIQKEAGSLKDPKIRIQWEIYE